MPTCPDVFLLPFSQGSRWSTWTHEMRKLMPFYMISEWISFWNDFHSWITFVLHSYENLSLESFSSISIFFPNHFFMHSRQNNVALEYSKLSCCVFGQFQNNKETYTVPVKHKSKHKKVSSTTRMWSPIIVYLLTTKCSPQNLFSSFHSQMKR